MSFSVLLQRRAIRGSVTAIAGGQSSELILASLCAKKLLSATLPGGHLLRISQSEAQT
jgi:hypothetical protein